MIMRALVVEDDAVARSLLKRVLTRFFPHNVLDAADGEAGWALLEQYHPAVVFCDMHMPKLDGVGLLRRMRAHPVHRDTPMIAITAEQEPAFVRQLVELGVADYLLKPIALEPTVKRLATLLPGLLAAAQKREEQALAAALQAEHAAGIAAAAEAELAPPSEGAPPAESTPA